MASVLPNDPSQVWHVILLTDGGAHPSGSPELVQTLHDENNITLTTVGVGRDAASFLPELAELGGGRYHFAADPSSIPSIFAEETTLATRAYLIEETFFPKLNSSSPILTGIQEVPPLYGYVGTSAKSAAQTILVSDKEDPILAAWQYGLGRAVAFTSDASGRWGKDWVAWPGFATFWAQAVGYTIGERTQSNLDVQVEHQGEQARLVVEAFDRGALEPGEAPEGYLNGYLMQANVVSPGGDVVTLDLRQVAPGRYEGVFTPAEQGAYVVRVTGQPPQSPDAAPEEGGAAATAGWVLSYSPEYRRLESDPDTLGRITAQAGGKIASQNPADVFRHDLPARQASRPVWPWLLALAAILLPLDIAARRLTVTAQDLRRGVEKLAGRLSGRLRKGAAEPTLRPARTQRMDALFQAKERARDVKPGPIPQPGSLTEAEAGAAKPGPVSTPESQPRPQAESSSKEMPPEPGVSTASTLLERKRLRQSQANKPPKDGE
ncbi:MAG: hypothetical protein EHM70_03070, partial [Chloroflexota bacterium]